MTSGRSELFLDVATELLSQGRRVRFRAPGCSMSPAILHGDAITVEPVRPPEVRTDDIVLYRIERRVIAHRVVGIQSESEAAPVFTLCGDAAGSAEERVESRQILGRVSTVERKSWSARLLHTARLGAGRLIRRMDSYRRGMVSDMLRRLAPGMMLLCLLVVCLASTPAYATDRTAIASASWGTAGTWNPAGVPTSSDNLTIPSPYTVTINANAVCNNLTISSGGTVTVGGAYTLGVSGTTSITGTINFNTQSANFSGDVTLNSGAVWHDTASSGMTFYGNFTNNATTFTAGSNQYTFAGATKTISGSTTTSITNVTFSGTIPTQGRCPSEA